MSEQLSLLAQSLTIPGVSITKRGLVFSAADDAQLLAVGHRLFAIKGFSKWALGSLFTEMLHRRPTKQVGVFDDSWLIDFCHANQVDDKERRELVGVATFYPADTRTYDLSYDHYREAMWGVHDGQPHQLRRALRYLHDAESNAWTVSQLRRHIRTSTLTEPKEQIESNLGGYSAVFDFRRFVTQQRANVGTMSPERARLILCDLGDETLQFIKALQAIAGQTPQGMAPWAGKV